MTLLDFLRESNLIEGIAREPTADELGAAERFMQLAQMEIIALNSLQEVFAPGRPLRMSTGMNVSVGKYLAPCGGLNIVQLLHRIVWRANDGDDPWSVHIAFEMLHPYMDGNGRTGRMLWAWQMQRKGHDPFAIPFLHRFYYQTLAAQKL